MGVRAAAAPGLWLLSMWAWEVGVRNGSMEFFCLLLPKSQQLLGEQLLRLGEDFYLPNCGKEWGVKRERMLGFLSCFCHWSLCDCGQAPSLLWHTISVPVKSRFG